MGQFSLSRTLLSWLLVLSACCVLEASTSRVLVKDTSEPIFYGMRKAQVLEVMCVLPQGAVFSVSLQSDLRDVLNSALQTFEQSHDEIMILNIHDAHEFNAKTRWARVLVKQKGARQTWWVKSPKVPEEPDWSDAIGFAQGLQFTEG